MILYYIIKYTPGTITLSSTREDTTIVSIPFEPSIVMAFSITATGNTYSTTDPSQGSIKWGDGDGGKNEYDVVKFTAVGNTTYSYNYGNCINPTGSVIVFKLSNGNTSAIQKADIPTNGQFTTPADCVEVLMSIKYGSKDSLNMHTV